MVPSSKTVPALYPEPEEFLATPPGLEVTAKVTLVEVSGRKLVFEVEAHDGVDRISQGRHERFIINREKFDARVGEKKRNG